MNNIENIKWEKMLSTVMTEGKKIKRRNTVIKSLGALSIGIALFISVFATTYKNNDFDNKDLMARDLYGSEVEITLIAADTFFDSELEMLMY